MAGVDSNQWRPRQSDIPPAPDSIPSLIWQTLYSRGYSNAGSVKACLSPSLKNLRHPLSLNHMDKAVERLMAAFQQNEKVCIYADFDMDGTSGLALLKNGLERLGFSQVMGYQPRRLSEGYGVHVPAVQEISKAGATLMVTVDVGITAFAALEEAERLGLDVIVTDHHLPKDEGLPKALAVVNPNKGTCTSDLGHLSGAGVAYYLFLALRSALKEQLGHEVDFDPKELLDCFVIGTLTDMVPMIDENRVLVRHGLVQLARTKRPGLRALLERLEMADRELTSQDVAMRFAPKLNALSRIEADLRPIDIFLVEDVNEAERLVGQVLERNDLRVSLQKKADGIARQMLADHPPLNSIWVWSTEFHRGIVGLVATRLAQDFGLPAFVGALDESGAIVGSSRVPNGSKLNVLNGLTASHAALVRYGGHAQAAGFEIEVARAEDFRKYLEAFYAQPLEATSSAEAVSLFDANGSVNDFTDDFMRWFGNLGPFGTQFEPPVFKIDRARVHSVRELRGGHLKLEISDPRGGPRLSSIWFSPKWEHPWSDFVGTDRSLEVLGEPSWNHYKGSKTLQFQIHGARPI